MAKGQSVIETMVSIGVILIFILLLYNFLVYPRLNQTNSAQVYYSAKTVCADLASAINVVAYNGNGFSQKVSIPASLYGRGYSIAVYPALVQISWDKGIVYCQFRAKNVSSGNLSSLNLTDHVLTNLNGVVQIA
jgi:hypothetical protein